MPATTINDEITDLLCRITCGQVDGWDKKRAQERLKEIARKTTNNKVKERIQGVLGKDRKE